MNRIAQAMMINVTGATAVNTNTCPKEKNRNRNSETRMPDLLPSFRIKVNNKNASEENPSRKTKEGQACDGTKCSWLLANTNRTGHVAKRKG
jgi:hypothetical protein